MRNSRRIDEVEAVVLNSKLSDFKSMSSLEVL